MCSVHRLLAAQDDDDQPDLDLEEFEGDWEEIFEDATIPVELTTTEPSAPLDFYPNAGTLGIVSERLGRWLSEVGDSRLVLRPVQVDGRRYFQLIAGDPLDALDREGARYSVFSSDPTRIKRVQSFAFDPQALPTERCAFTVPELPDHLFLNGEAANSFQAEGFSGCQLVVVWEEARPAD